MLLRPLSSIFGYDVHYERASLVSARMWNKKYCRKQLLDQILALVHDGNC